MRVLVFVGFFLPGYKGGGPIRTIKNLLDQTSNEVGYQIVTSDRDLGDTSPYDSIRAGEWNKANDIPVFYIQPGLTGIKSIAKIINKKNYDVIYLNSFFSIRFSLIPLVIAKVLQQKIILGPRGEFSSGALSLKSGKKYNFIKLYKLLGLHNDIVFQASSRYEKEDIQRVLGDKVAIKIAEDLGAKDFVTKIPMRIDSAIKAVFVSRISPMKNIITALEILKNVQRPTTYHIYGPIEDIEYWTKCETLINTLPEHIDVQYKGVLKPDNVLETISKYDLFFMPTKGENYSHVIAEALRAGLPILIADTTPWRNLQEQGIGWDLPLNDLQAFSDIIDKLAKMPQDEHHKMRETVLAWAKNKFSQRDAIDANIAMFDYAIDKNRGI